MTQAKIQLIPTIIFAIVLYFLYESPEYLRNRNKREVIHYSFPFKSKNNNTFQFQIANKSRQWYKGSVFSVGGSTELIEKGERSGYILVPKNENASVNLENGREKALNEQKTDTSISFRDFCNKKC